jgi:hypothetical protein
MKKAKSQSAGSTKKNSQKEEVSGRSKSGQGGGLQPLGAQKRAPHRLTTVPREGDTNTTVPRE